MLVIILRYVRFSLFLYMLVVYNFCTEMIASCYPHYTSINSSLISPFSFDFGQYLMHNPTNGWTDGRNYRRWYECTDGRTVGRRNERRDRRTDGRMDGWMERPTDWRMDGWTSGRTDRRTDGPTVGRTDGRTEGQKIDGWTDGRTDEMARARPSAKNLKYDFYRSWYLPSNNTIAKVVLKKVDLFKIKTAK